MQLPVIIPEPCLEQWDQMETRDNGRHCFACQKTVVDFTGWEADTILNYLKSNKQTCGRFTADQLPMQQPAVPASKAFSWWSSVMRSGLSALGKIAAAVVLLFHLASCDAASPVTGNKPVDNDITTTGKPLLAAAGHPDDVPDNRGITVPPVPKKPAPIEVSAPEPVLMGEPVMADDSAVVTEPGSKPQIMGGPMLVIPQKDTVSTIQK